MIHDHAPCPHCEADTAARDEQYRLHQNAAAEAYNRTTTALVEARAASQLALDCHDHHAPTCACWIPSARAAL